MAPSKTQLMRTLISLFIDPLEFRSKDTLSIE
jgi:hypothetical protein